MLRILYCTNINKVMAFKTEKDYAIGNSKDIICSLN